MVQVSQEEAAYIRKHFKWITVSRTMRDKSDRGKYYAPESSEVLSYLNNARSKQVTAHMERV